MNGKIWTSGLTTKQTQQTYTNGRIRKQICKPADRMLAFLRYSLIWSPAKIRFRSQPTECFL